MEKDRQRNEHDQSDRFSRLMFGDRREPTRHRHHEETKTNLSSLDYQSIIDNVVKLRDSTQNLKPLLQMVYPFVEKFMKKK